MADNEEGERTTAQGNEWEVVSLTASAYAAAPGPDGVESVHEDKSNKNNDSEAETSRALFMSGHFVFPPSEHENLPIVPDNAEIQKGEKEVDQGVSGTLPEEGDFSEQKGEGKWDITGLSVPDVLHSIYDDKGVSIHGSDFEDDTAIHGSATTMGGSIYDESKVSSSLRSPSEASLNPCDDQHSEDRVDDDELPPGAWWKKQVASLRAHAKDTNTFWSIFIAAAVMGLVILGKQWQQERWQVLQHRWHLNLNAEVCFTVSF